MADYALLKKLKLTNPWHLLAVGLGTGLCPKAPGTCGSFGAMLIGMVVVTLAPWYVLTGLAVILYFLGVKACNEAERAMGVHDHGGIVVDEFVGMFISMLWIPQGQWQLALIAFVLFRIFDIAKPFPVGWADHNITGGTGIMVDDVLAGLYALICGALLWYFSGDLLLS